MTGLEIHVSLQADRTRPGKYSLWQNKKEIWSAPCLARADSAEARRRGNPSRDPLRQCGDTPTGEYRCNLAGPWAPEGSYGPHQVLTMEPTGGQALLAKERGKRSGLATHGGALGPTGKLRPTHGCVRLANEDMRDLAAMVQGYRDIPCRVVEE